MIIADSGLSSGAVGAIVVVMVLLLLILAIVSIIIIAVVIHNKQRTYDVESSTKNKSNIYVEVPSSPRSVSDDSGSMATVGATVQTSSKPPGAEEEGNSKFIVDFKVTEADDEK